MEEKKLYTLLVYSENIAVLSVFSTGFPGLLLYIILLIIMPKKPL